MVSSRRLQARRLLAYHRAAVTVHAGPATRLQGGAKFPTGGMSRKRRARERSAPHGVEVSRPGAMPGPTVTVRMKEDVPMRFGARFAGVAGTRLRALKCFSPSEERFNVSSHFPTRRRAAPSRTTGAHPPCARRDAQRSRRAAVRRRRPRKRSGPDRRRRASDRAHDGAVDPRGQRHRLPVPARCGARALAGAADGRAQRMPARHRVHRLDRSAARRDHRRQRGRSRHDDPCGDRRWRVAPRSSASRCCTV